MLFLQKRYPVSFLPVVYSEYCKFSNRSRRVISLTIIETIAIFPQTKRYDHFFLLTDIATVCICNPKNIYVIGMTGHSFFRNTACFRFTTDTARMINTTSLFRNYASLLIWKNYKKFSRSL